MARISAYYSHIFLLNSKGIDSFSAILEQKLKELDVERENRLRIRFSLEEALLRLRDRFGEEETFHLKIIRRFGATSVLLQMEGEVFNPLSKTEVEIEDWSGSLLTAVGLSPLYSYSHGTNTLRVNLPRKGMNSALKILIAVAIGLVFGFCLRYGLGASTETFLAEEILACFYDLWIRLLSVLSGPVIFLMVCTSVLSAGSIAEEGGSKNRIIVRYFMLSIAAALLSVVCMSAVHHQPMTIGNTLGIEAEDYLSYIIKLVPVDPVSPFIDSNTPQLLFMAFVIGNGIVIAGSRAEGLNSLVRQGNMVGTMLTEGVSRCVPFFTAVLLTMEILDDTMDLFWGLWGILLISVIAGVVFTAIVIGYVARKKTVPFKMLVSKLWPSFITTLRSGSINEGFGQMERDCIRKLGLEKHFTTVSVPYALVLYMPANVIGTLMFTIYAGAEFGIDISLGWILIAMVLSVVLFVATPPVPGANLLAYIMIFDLLGIPSSALIDAMIFDLIFGIFASAANEVLVQMDLVLQADQLGLLDKEKLRKL